MSMIDINSILQWKQQYGEIHQTQILDQHFIFRPIGREEYKNIVIMDLDLGEFQELICSQSVIYPEEFDYSKGLAGIAEVLLEFILEVSGLQANQTLSLLQEYREEMLNFDYQADCMIHEAFPEYTLEEISSWPVKKTMFYLSRAEWILRNLKNSSFMYQQELEEMEQEQHGQQQPQQQEPQQREIRKELVEFQEPEKRDPVKPAPEGGVQSEEELLAMLSQSGAKISNPSTVMDEVKPELNWFQYMDELKGDFD
jgi:hypothetical protein